MDRLELIPSECWPQLRQLFARDWPRNIIPYYLLDNYIRWGQSDPTFIDQNVEVSCLNGDWSDGTFYLLHDNEIFFYSLDNNETEGRLARLLYLVRHKRSYMWTAYTYKRHLPSLNKALERMSWHQTFVEPTKFYHISYQKASLLDVTIPEGLSIRPLAPQDLEYAHSQYPYRDEVRLPFFQMLHKFNKNLGIYDHNNDLLAWCLLHQPNAFTALQVRPNRRRTGLGSTLLRIMSKSLADERKDSFAIIVDGNEASTNLFQKEGFDCIDEVFNIRIEPKQQENTVRD